ncbi:MAG: FAD-binding oxidoreductase [Candidatus Omnitrophica bacterium]|nr:FAD-binding oxidoreductase [Candidatus Omnitrophota bacterium]
MVREQEAVIREVIERSPFVKSCRLTVPEEIPYTAGQFMCVSYRGEPACRRYLSFSSSPTERGYIEFTKRLTGSDFSRFLNSARPGDTVRVRYPYGSFTLREDDRKIAFLCGGIGITPVRSMCRYAVDSGQDRDMVLIYANRSINEIVFRDDFESLRQRSRHLRVAHVLCEPAEGFRCSVGFINERVIRDEIPDFAERRFYICGPPPMVAAMKDILTNDLKLSDDRVVMENFSGYG